MVSPVDRLFSQSKKDITDVRSLVTKIFMWEKLLVALATYQATTKKPTSRDAMFFAKVRLSGKLILRSSLQHDIGIMLNKGYIERASRAKYLVTKEGHKYARAVKKSKGVTVWYVYKLNTWN